jgi:hypothetical protein
VSAKSGSPKRCPRERERRPWFYGAFKALKPKDGRRITIHFGARVKVSRDDPERLESLGLDLAFEKTEEEQIVRSDAERQFQKWVRQNVHNIPGLHDAEGLDAEVARLREKDRAMAIFPSGHISTFVVTRPALDQLTRWKGPRPWSRA